MTQRELPPGPAFISAASIGPAWYDGTRPDIEWPGDDEDYWRMEYNVPRGYMWRPATDCTPAGWVRPMGYWPWSLNPSWNPATFSIPRPWRNATVEIWTDLAHAATRATKSRRS